MHDCEILEYLHGQQTVEHVVQVGHERRFLHGHDGHRIRLEKRKRRLNVLEEKIRARIRRELHLLEAMVKRRRAVDVEPEIFRLRHRYPLEVPRSCSAPWP
jgi:hypothetical protein